MKINFREIIRLPKRMFWGLVMEGAETRQMLNVFARHGSGKIRFVRTRSQPTPEEMGAAVEQLKDIPRFLPFFVIVVVPLPGVAEGYALVAMTLERWLGRRIRLLPTQFSQILRRDKDE